MDSLGDAHRHAGKYKEAWEYYNKSVEINPNFTNPHSHLGDIKQELGFYKEAIPFYQDALKTLLPEKDISESHYNIADAFWRVKLANNYIYLGEVDKAEKEVSAILQHNTNSGNIYGHYLAAEIALKRGDIYKAKEEAELVQKLEKENNFFNRENDQIVNFIRAKIALVEKDLDSAEKFALAAIDAFPEGGRSFLLSSVYPLGNDRRICAEPLNLLAEIRRKQGKIDEEIQTIKKSLELISHQPKLYNRLGEIYTEQNKKEDAVQAYKNFLTLCEDFNCCDKYKEKAEKYIANSEGYKTISGEELLNKIKSKGHIILIDCRPPEEYNAGHILGAVNVSMDSFGFKEDTAVKAAMAKIIKQVGKKIDFILIDTATSEEYMPKTKIMELIKYLPENRDKEVIFYCRKPT
jgi:tetratricopeptide (TPR) repeat protein